MSGAESGHESEPAALPDQASSTPSPSTASSLPEQTTGARRAEQNHVESAPNLASDHPEPDTSGNNGEATGSSTAESLPADGNPVVSAAITPEPPISVPPVVDITELDWDAIRDAVDPAAIRSRMRMIVEGMEAALDEAHGPGLMFDDCRQESGDRAIQVAPFDTGAPLWFVGDLHGDLLAFEAAMALVRSSPGTGRPGRIVFLGDFFDDGGFGLEVLLLVFETFLAAPAEVTVICGNHDEALAFDGRRFTASVEPCDFADFLNAHAAHEWIERTGKVAIRLFAHAPRALFFPDGLLAAHGGFPLQDLHGKLLATADWNDPACLEDFVWTRAHPTARRKMPNRFTKGSQFGYQDFADFCDLAASLGRPVTHMVRGHDHVEDRYAVFPAYAHRPILTTVALSRRLPRELFGSATRVPTIARYCEGKLPQVYRLHIPSKMIEEVYPEEGKSQVQEAGAT
jgi:hypothetical protein